MLNNDVTKNPLVLYRGSDISKEWYFKMKSTSGQLTKLISDIKVLTKKIELEKDALTAQLSDHFAKNKNKLVLNVKRDVHNLRLKKMKRYDEETLQVLKEIDLSVILQLLNIKEKLETEFTTAYKDVLDRNREILQCNINDEELLKTIIFFNEMIYEKVGKYMNTDTKSHNKKLKKLDYFLVKLMMRASMKTSPFSYLTKIGSSSPSFTSIHSANVEVNHAMVFNMFYGFLRSNEDAIKKIPVEVANFGRKASKIYYVSQHSTTNSKKVYETSDKFVEFQLEPSVIDFIEKYKGKELTYAHFKSYLNSLQLYQGQEIKVFKKLVELKVLIQKVNVGANRDILTSMIGFLKGYKLDPKFIDALHTIHASMNRFENGGIEERRSAWSEVKAISNQWACHGMKFGNELLFEDVVFNKNEKDLVSHKVTDEFITCLSDFILLFDVNIRVQYELAELFRLQYGNEIVGLSNSKMLNEIFFRNINFFYPYYQSIEYRYDNAIAKEIHILDDLRDGFIKELTVMMDQFSESELNIKPLIMKYANKIPNHFKSNSETSLTLFAQHTDEKVVINDVYDGQEKFLSRFKDFFEVSEQNEDYIAYLNKNYTNKNYYEVDELFGFNGGIHEREYRNKVNLNIGYQKFKSPDLPSIDEFYVKYDGDTRKLKLLDHQFKNAKIAYKSSLVPIFLPGVLSIMLLLFQSGRLNFDVNRIGLMREQLPRLTFDQIVMYRRRWNLNHDQLLQLIERSAHENERYKMLLHYFQFNNLPRQFFLKFYKNEDQFSREKPIFIDLDIPLLFRLFVNECKSSVSQNTKMYIEEALPGPSSPLREYMVEYTVDKTPSNVYV
ncbi:lanthionine biosynthesis protein [Alteribacter populi]|uniref:lanthionine biosynthesis protein n=1 Tax=Alteribacter populi TaxID=2011011 RepID=UPI0012FFD213|nr:lanthionine biosynthesis protein [Alteribacter populi]